MSLKRRSKEPRRRTVNRELKEAITFLAPLVLLLLTFVLLPVAGTIWNSVFKDVTFMERVFIGLRNYQRLFASPQFWQSSLFTLMFPIVSVFLELVCGMMIALVLNEQFKLRGLVRGICLLPWAIPSVIGARIWQLIYRFDYGLANFLLAQANMAPVNWLGTPVSAFLSLVLADVWRTTPFVAIIFLAGLQMVPHELHNQAKVDGAHLLQRFFRITVPILKPIIVIALLFRTIDAIRVFDLIYVITSGGPGGTTTSLSLFGYKYFLLGDFGQGSAVSVVLFAAAFACSLLLVRIGRFRESIL